MEKKNVMITIIKGQDIYNQKHTGKNKTKKKNKIKLFHVVSIGHAN